MDTLEVSEPEKAQLQEVADGMLKIYRTMARMRYLKPEWIEQGPHDLSDKIDGFRANHTDAIIYLYSILPYVNAGGAQVDFFEGGEFINFREGWSQLDPLCADEPNEQIRPWMTVLSDMGNCQTWITYSARDHCIWIRDGTYGGTGPEVSDLGDPENYMDVARDQSDDDDEEEQEEEEEGEEENEYDADGEARGKGEQDKEGRNEVSQNEDGNDVEGEDDETEDCDIENEEEGEDDEDEDCEMDYYSDGGSDGDYAYEVESARPAAGVLSDIDRWYHSVKTLPGWGEHSEEPWVSGSEVITTLYRQYGWPSEEFDGDGFLVALVRSSVVEPLTDTMRYAFRNLFNSWKDVIGQEREYGPEKETRAVGGDKWMQRFYTWKDAVNETQRARSRMSLEEMSAFRWHDGGDRAARLRRRMALREVQELRAELDSGNIAEGSAAWAYEPAYRAAREEAEAEVEAEAEAEAAARGEHAPVAASTWFVEGREPRESPDAMIRETLRLADEIPADVEAARAWVAQVPPEAAAAHAAGRAFIDGLEKCLNDGREFARSWSVLDAEGDKAA